MGKNLTRKILEKHLVCGEMHTNQEIAIRIDQTLTPDVSGTMAYLQFEVLDIPRVRTELSVSYVDHNTLQTGFENADDHRFLQTVAAKYGIYFSRPGNGICHQVHLERFGIPGKTLLGSDSHTQTAGGIGMIGIGAGGLDVAVALGGGEFHLSMPKVIRVNLIGRLQPWVTAKDVILELLRIMTVKGGVGKIIEYAGPGLASVSVPERATISNMGAETGATSSVFPSDERTLEFLRAQGREKDWVELKADPDAIYDETIEINLSELEPMVALPHMPDQVTKIKDIGPIKVDQVLIGSCTNSSYVDIMRVAKILKGKTIHPEVNLAIAPGSKQVLTMISKNGALADIIAAGARILESACGPCIGMGFSPNSGGISVRTNNRNFVGRSGTVDAKIYITSPESAAATALRGFLTDPRELGNYPQVTMPETFLVEDNMIIAPAMDPSTVTVSRGPNIAPLPVSMEMPEAIKGSVLLKVGNNITTDHILPSGPRTLPLRSNVPKISEYVFWYIDPTFAARAKGVGGGLIIGGSNYGQGSSREHAALAPMYLGVKAVIAKSFARIHMDNLVNFGILPLVFLNEADYNSIAQGDELKIEDVARQLTLGSEIIIKDLTKEVTFRVKNILTNRQIDIVLSGGRLNYIRNRFLKANH